MFQWVMVLGQLRGVQISLQLVYFGLWVHIWIALVRQTRYVHLWESQSTQGQGMIWLTQNVQFWRVHSTRDILDIFYTTH